MPERRDVLEDLPTPVAGAVVDDDQLALHAFWKRSREDLGEAALQDRALVVDRNQDRQLHKKS
jgi:hypothetical protein